MKASARLITGSLRATAHLVGDISAQAFAQPSGMSVKARPTEDSGLLHFLNVAPSEPQQLVWLVPQVGIDYAITTSTGLHWQIK